MEKAEDGVKRVASFMDSWWKIMSMVGALVFFIYQISAVWIANKDLQEEFDAYKEEVQKTFDTKTEWQLRRHEQTMQMINELTSHGLKLQETVQKHLIDDAYQRGKVGATLEALKKSH